MPWVRKFLQRAVLPAAIAVSLVAQSTTVIVRPREIHDLLVNPGMGITTFQRYNGDALNADLKWSEAGPTAALESTAQILAELTWAPVIIAVPSTSATATPIEPNSCRVRLISTSQKEQ